MKKFIKKFLKWTGITLLLIIGLLILIPILFKDQIKELVINEVNKSLTAELSLEDFDLTFFSTFPNMTIDLINAKLTGKNDFEGVTLADVKEIRAHVGLWDVITGDQIEIDEVHIIEPKIDVRVLENGLANYDIVKPDSLKTPEEVSEPSSFKLSLQEYSIQNGQIKYDDRSSDMFAEIVNLNHTGEGDLTADVIDFKTSTSMDELTYDMGGLSYLSKVKTDMDINLLMEFKENSSKFTLNENQISLNEITLAIHGFYEMLESHDNIELELDASKATFKEFLSLIPVFYHSGYESMISSGELALNAKVNGKIDDKNLPGWDVDLSVHNGSVKYPDLPGKINNIQVVAGSKFEGGENLDKMTVDVPRFHANLSKNSVDANLALRSMMSDPYIQSKIKANLDLSTLKDFVPLGEEETYNGILDADVDIKGKLSALDREDYEAFTAKGTLVLSDFLYASNSVPDDVHIDKMKFTFSPENLTMNELNAKMGVSDFAMSGAIDNYFGYALRNETVKGDFTFNSNFLDLDEMIPSSESTNDTAPEETVTSEAASSEDPLLVPKNVDFNLRTNIKKTKYNDVFVEDVQGNVRLKDEIASLDNLTMKALGGTVGLNGNYDTRNHQKPKMNFGYSLKSLNIHDLATHFVTIEKLAPIAKYAKGKISSDFNMTTDLTASFEPILTSLTSVGDISSSSIKISGFKNLEKLENVTKLKNISNQTLKNFYTKFKVEDGKISLTPFDVKLGKIGTEVSGYTTLDQKMDYSLKMNVPKTELPKEIVQEVDGLLKKANSAIPFVNIGTLPNIIPVKVKMTGNVSNPKITTDMKEAIMNAVGLEDNLMDNIKETIKDTVQAVVDDTIDKAKEELEKQKQKILDDAQKQADKLKAECVKQAENIWHEAYKQADDAVAKVGSNIIQKKLAEEAAKLAKKEADNQLNKAFEQCQQQADKIMDNARKEADNLGDKANSVGN